MPRFKCGICGKEHNELLLDLGYMHPADFFKIPPAEHGGRIKFNQDVCVIDGTEFYVRGILPLPIKDTAQEFRWGVWARIEKKDFRRYLELWNAEAAAHESPFLGHLSGGLRDYSDSDMLQVQVQLQPGNQRPRFYVVSASHPLGIDQRQGITMQKVHIFIEPMLSGH
jgi:hypothetical protein